MTFQTTTCAQIIDRARIRHWSFADVVLGDGAVLQYLSQRLRTHLALHGAKIEGLVNTTMTYQVATVNGLLVVEVAGVPQYTTTYQDGWPIHVDAFGVPYYDTTEPKVATDPYGLHGGTPGFPLPSEMVRLIDVSAVYGTQPGLTIPIDVIPEHGRMQSLPGRNPNAFVSGNRLVPVVPQPGSASNPNAGDRWANVSSLIISYVALPTLALLTDYLNIPGVLVEALDADCALLMARNAKHLPANLLPTFERAASDAGLQIASAAVEMLGEPQSKSVRYKG